MAEAAKLVETDKPLAHLPDDILIEIYLRLSVRILFRYRSVCKRWLRLLKDPIFISLHVNRLIDNRIDDNPLLMLRRLRFHNDETEKIVFTIRSETLPYNADVPLKLFSPSMASRDFEVRLIGPINGVFCITDMVELVVLNPATRQFKNVPYNHSPNTPQINDSDYLGFFANVGFGFDSVSKDYKLVRFVKFNHHRPDVYYKVGIYSLSKNTWRELNCAVPPGYRFSLRSYSFFFNGAFHWLVGEDIDEYFDDFSSILVFDLNEEAFKWFKLPDLNRDTDDFYVYFLVLNESLSMIVYRISHSLSYYKTDIWAMTEYGIDSSWMQLYNFDHVREVERPLSFGKNEELLVEILRGENAHLGLFNFITREIEEIYAGAYRGTLHAFRYRESLISLE